MFMPPFLGGFSIDFIQLKLYNNFILNIRGNLMSKMEENAKWLHEKNLKGYLEKIFNKEFIHNKQIPDSGLKYRPDYRNEELKLLVEFDGPRHYTSAKTVFLDKKKDKLYSDLGYKVVRIPYFIQIETRTIEALFGIKKDIPQVYPHGFNEKNVVLPADFCSTGILRFKKELDRFNNVFDDVKSTLYKKIEEAEDVDCVLPESLFVLWNSDYSIIMRGNSEKVYIRLLLKGLLEGASKEDYDLLLRDFVFNIYIYGGYENPQSFSTDLQKAFKYFKKKDKLFKNIDIEKAEEFIFKRGINNFEKLDWEVKL